ncbi:MAG: hypothetical protein QXV27_05390, partial [Candidatus Caldarchaeum sp.]
STSAPHRLKLRGLENVLLSFVSRSHASTAMPNTLLPSARFGPRRSSFKIPPAPLPACSASTTSSEPSGWQDFSRSVQPLRRLVQSGASTMKLVWLIFSVFDGRVG